MGSSQNSPSKGGTSDSPDWKCLTGCFSALHLVSATGGRIGFLWFCQSKRWELLSLLADASG